MTRDVKSLVPPGADVMRRIGLFGYACAQAPPVRSAIASANSNEQDRKDMAECYARNGVLGNTNRALADQELAAFEIES